MTGKRLLILAAAAAFAVADSAAAQPSTVVLVRHAEKAAGPGADPALSEAGVARARSLAAVLADAGVGHVITTQFQRTRATAAPFADGAGVTPATVPATSDFAGHVRAVADAVRALPAGAAVLVVGHSNTIPAIIHALGGPEMPELCESEYDKLFILELDATPQPRLVRGRFGAPDDPAAPPCTRAMRQ
ncbi:MAG TPA: phosphoglycerate mutase family protein [Gemmatimonadaceae bacterium]|nr:phosphoglycerate mutase family protein [Gemmatimonadaceae bacterium]